MTTAVAQQGAALRFASLRLRGEEDVVRMALRSDDMALCWASQEQCRCGNDALILVHMGS